MWTSLGALILPTLVCPLASKDSHAKSHVQNAFTSPQNLQKSYALQYQIEIQKTSHLNTISPGASLVAQWLRVCLLMQGTRVRALVWEDPTCRGATGPVSHNY